MSSFLREPVDFARHNEEVQAVMTAYDQGRPIRVPFKAHGSITNFFFNRELNTKHLSFEQFFKDPEVQIQAQLAYRHWCRHNLLCDQEMGMPREWNLNVDFQNSYDASWAGAEMIYIPGGLPDTKVLLEPKEKLYDMPKRIPVENGLIGVGIEFIDFMEAYCREHEFMDRPIRPPRAFLGEGCDGVFDLAYKLRGVENLLMDMMEDEEYYSDLMEWLTDNLIYRMTTLRKRHKERWGEEPGGFFFADDAITMLSHDMYRQYVLPYHKRIFDAMSGGKKCGLHLCGANMQHFSGLVRELPIGALDTGFPIDLGLLRRQVGPDVEISGGPTVMLAKNGSAQALCREGERILRSGVMEGGKFIMILANNMAPGTPVENIAALYETVRRSGVYRTS